MNSTNVYWTGSNADTLGPGAVLSVPIGGGAVTTLLALPQGDSAEGLAIDSANVYFIDGALATVEKMPLGGGTVTVLAKPGINAIGPLVVDSTNVYWIGSGDLLVLSVPIGGGTVTTLASNPIGSSAIYPTQIAVDETNVYWTNGGQDTVMSTPKGSTGAVPPVVLATGQTYANGIAVDATSIYWANSGWDATLGSIVKLPKAGGPPVTLAANLPRPTASVSGPNQIAVDATNVYWTNDGDNFTVQSVPINGGAVTTLATGTPGSGGAGITTYGGSVYWVNDSAEDGVVRYTP